MYQSAAKIHKESAGFSLLELLIAMTISLVILALATTILAASLNVRSREDSRAQAIADVQRGLNLMTREIANSGFRLPIGLTHTNAGGSAVSIPANGIVATDSSATALRVLSNLDDPGTDDTGSGSVTGTANEDEDVLFSLYTANGNSLLVRHDNNFAERPTTVLANRIDGLTLRYFNQRVNYTANPDLATCNIVETLGGATELLANNEAQAPQIRYIVASVCVTLPPVGTPGQEGFQPAARVQLTSDVLLRNGDLTGY